MDKKENQERDSFLESLHNNIVFSKSGINKKYQESRKEEDIENINNENDLNENEENLFSDISSKNSNIQSSGSHSNSPSHDYKRRNKRSKSRSRSPKAKRLKFEDDKDDSSNFIMKNGCCRHCMRAFSKSGKSCLCQVPRSERKYTLPEIGCNICGCHGKNLFLKFSFI